MLALLLSGCIENSIVEGADQFGAWPVTLEDGWFGPDMNLSIDIALQRNHWGNQVSRCQIQLAFVAPGSDGWGAPAGPDAPPGSLIYPETPGECIYTDLYVVPDTSPGEGEDPDDPDDSDLVENWNLAGAFEGADVLWLHSGYRSIALERTELGEDEVRYQWNGCNEADFPFGEVFDIDAPASSDPDGIQAFYIEEAFGIGPDLDLLTPVDQPGDGGTVFHTLGRSLPATWEHLDEGPLVRGGKLGRRVDVVIRNFDDERKALEGVVCLSDDDQFTTPAMFFDDLQSNPDHDTENYSLGYQIDAVYNSPAFEAPWGQFVRVRSMITEGGNVHLYDGGPQEAL